MRRVRDCLGMDIRQRVLSMVRKSDMSRQWKELGAPILYLQIPSVPPPSFPNLSCGQPSATHQPVT
jgi:hypothetical protein